MVVTNVVVADLAVPTAEAPPNTSAPVHVCASPRRREPLLRDARRIARGEGSIGGILDYEGLLTTPTDIEVVTDEAVCRALANQVLGTSEKPLLVVRVGKMYLADAQEDRHSGFWGVELFDAELKSFGLGYGEGS